MGGCFDADDADDAVIGVSVRGGSSSDGTGVRRNTLSARGRFMADAAVGIQRGMSSIISGVKLDLLP